LKKNISHNEKRGFAASFLRGLWSWRRQAFSIGFVVATFCMSVTLLPVEQGISAESANPPKKSQGQSDVQILEGRWIRYDGGYVLELGEFKKDGSLKASYFNPRPIRVFSATWSRKDKKIHLFVELRDINYPGSKYNLEYDPKSDRLKGTYFQAVEKQTYDIEFVRVK
jgi:hypothetical protein